ncbi:MAG: hypothetical protein EPO24_04755 [Bacteroidetes bacterium]|nr:MAG: hypothetical protein EPO24_04755 [Bacteroidota bacterium]
MKRIVVYVNTMRVHWLVEALQAIGINEIMVNEYFKQYSQASRFQFLCEDCLVERARELVHQIGTSGTAADHYFGVFDYDPTIPSLLPLGQQVSPLEG